MNSKIKIAFYAHSIDCAGTWRSHENIALNINKNNFTPYILFWPANLNNTRLDYLKNTGIELIPFERSLEKGDAYTGFTPIHTNFSEVVKQLNPDILHVARGGYYEWPLIERLCGKQIETNVFGYTDLSGFVDKSLGVSKYVCDRTGYSMRVYNPIKPPVSKPSLRSNLGISDKAIVYGRIGRADINWDMALTAFKYIEDRCRKPCYFLVLGAKADKREKNVIFLKETSDDDRVASFYNTIDVFLHSREDGETFGCCIAEAMTYGIPVVSHLGTKHNGHIDTLKNAGVIANDFTEYVDSAILFGRNEAYRKYVGDIGIKESKRFLIKNVVPEYELVYEELKEKSNV